MGDSERLRVVIHPLTLSREIQPYIALLADALSDRGITVDEYRTMDVVLDPPDVIHFHWPEHVLARSPLRKLSRALLLLATLRIARIRGATLVLTAHNAFPHDLDATGFNGWFLRAFDSLVDGVLVLSRAGWDEIVEARPGLVGAVVTHTRHGDFQQAYPPPVSTRDARRMLGLDPERPLIVCPGQVRRYKGVPELLNAARGVDADVLVAGSCTDDDLRRMLERRAQADERIHLRLEHLPAETLAHAISAASVVALPYRNVLNSGSAILALSLGRPVLVPPTPSFRELRDEVGQDWVMACAGEPISSNDLESSLAAVRADEPKMDSYRWANVASDTEIGYWRAIVNRKMRR
jgi:glycosyltransferase involved in cell wall biosynthesis